MGTELISDHFDVMAGAGFGVFGVGAAGAAIHSRTGGEAYPLTDSQFTWLIVCETLARHDDEQIAWRWLVNQLLSAAFCQLPLFEKLCAVVQNSWSAVVPLLMLPKETRQTFGATFQDSFVASEHHRLIQRLLLTLFDRYGANLFSPGDWLAEVKNDSRYSTSDQACVVKLGLTLKWLAEHSENDDRSTWEAWQQQLKVGVLHVLPHRVTRGFAPEAAIFEDVVLALLTTAEWLTYEKSWRIYDYLADTDRRDTEKLSDDQKVLAGALYGYIRGYRGIGNWVSGPQQRSAIARQSLCLAAKQPSVTLSSPTRVSSIVFFNTEDGTLSSFLQPYIAADQMNQIDQITRGRDGRLHIMRQFDLCLQLAQGAFEFDISVK